DVHAEGGGITLRGHAAGVGGAGVQATRQHAVGGAVGGDAFEVAAVGDRRRAQRGACERTGGGADIARRSQAAAAVDADVAVAGGRREHGGRQAGNAVGVDRAAAVDVDVAAGGAGEHRERLPPAVAGNVAAVVDGDVAADRLRVDAPRVAEVRPGIGGFDRAAVVDVHVAEAGVRAHRVGHPRIDGHVAGVVDAR